MARPRDDDDDARGRSPAKRPPGKLTRRLNTVLDVARRAEGTMVQRFHVRAPFYALRVLVQVVRQWARDRCPQQAAALSFETALSLVPITAIALSLLRAVGALEAQSALIQAVSHQFNPIARDEIAEQLVQWSQNLGWQTAGIAGLVSTLVLSYIMFSTVEKTWNDIWRVDRRRTLGQRFVTFYSIFTIVPALLGLSLYQAARVGLTRGMLAHLWALLATFGALLFANKMLPAIKVTWRAAATGALLSAIIFEAAKLLFQAYVSLVAMKSYSGIYGALGVLPLLLVWVYVSWLVVLFGAEVAHATQNLGFLEGMEKRAAREEDAAIEVSGPNGVRVLVEIARRWKSAEPAPTRVELGDGLEIAEEAMEHLLKRLKLAGLIVEVEGGEIDGWVPGRAPGQVQITDVLALFRPSDAHHGAQPALASALVAIETATRDATRGFTIETLTLDPPLPREGDQAAGPRSSKPPSA